MADKKDDDKKIRSRRNFLIGGASALLAGGAAWSLLSGNETPIEKATFLAEPAGDMTRDIDQIELNGIYNNLYAKIKHALDNKKSGKPLAIIIAEDHTGTHSLITQLMILNIARRFGISTYAWEDTPAKVDRFKQDTRAIVQKYQESLTTVQNGLNPENDPAKPPISEAIARSFVNMIGVTNNRKDGQLWIPTYACVNALLSGYNIIAMDPDQEKIESSQREPGMIEVLGSQKQNYVTSTGFAHASTLAKALKEKGQDVLLIDIVNKKIDPSTLPPDFARRYNELNEIADIKVVINGKPPIRLNQYFAHAVEAEFESLYEKNLPMLAFSKQVMRRELQLDQAPGRGK